MTSRKLDFEAYRAVTSLMSEHKWWIRKENEVIELYNLCDSDSQQHLVMDLLRRFVIVDSQKLDELGTEVANTIVNTWNLSHFNTKFIAIAEHKSGEVDGSHALLQSIKNKFVPYDWSSANFVSSIGKGAYAVQDNDTAILFDDFIGTGTKIVDRTIWFKEKLKELGKKNVDVRIVSLAICEDTMLNIYLDGTVIFSPILLRKGITDFYPATDVPSKIQLMLELENKLEEECTKRQLHKFSLGYGKSEVIFNIDGFNVPDNVFPIFWWAELKGKLKRKVIFYRLH